MGQLFVTVAKTGDNQTVTIGKVYFGSVLHILDYDTLASLLRARSEVVYRCRSTEGTKLLALLPGIPRQPRRGRSPQLALWARSKWLNDLSQGPYLFKVPPVSNNASPVTKIL